MPNLTLSIGGRPLKIQCSDLTCRFLRDAPQYSFKLEQREDMVDLKGKGLTQTYWISGITGTRSKLLTGELELASNMKEDDDPFVQSMALSEQKWTRIGFPDSSLVSATSDDNTMVNRLTAVLEYRLSLALTRERNTLVETSICPNIVAEELSE